MALDFRTIPKFPMRVFPGAKEFFVPMKTVTFWNLVRPMAFYFGPYLIIFDSTKNSEIIVQTRFYLQGGVKIAENPMRFSYCTTEILDNESDLIGWLSCFREKVLFDALSVLTKEIQPEDPFPSHNDDLVRVSFQSLKACRNINYEFIKNCISSTLVAPWLAKNNSLVFKVTCLNSSVFPTPGLVAGKLNPKNSILEYAVKIHMGRDVPDVDLKGTAFCPDLEESKKFLTELYVSTMMENLIKYHLHHGTLKTSDFLPELHF